MIAPSRVVTKSRKAPLVTGRRGDKGRFVTLKSGRVIFIPKGYKKKWADVRDKIKAREEKERSLNRGPDLEITGKGAIPITTKVWRVGPGEDIPVPGMQSRLGAHGGKTVFQAVFDNETRTWYIDPYAEYHAALFTALTSHLERKVGYSPNLVLATFDVEEGWVRLEDRSSDIKRLGLADPYESKRLAAQNRRAYESAQRHLPTVEGQELKWGRMVITPTGARGRRGPLKEAPEQLGRLRR